MGRISTRDESKCVLITLGEPCVTIAGAVLTRASSACSLDTLIQAVSEYTILINMYLLSRAHRRKAMCLIFCLILMIKLLMHGSFRNIAYGLWADPEICKGGHRCFDVGLGGVCS